LSRNRAIIAAAGARKTQLIIDEAIAAAPRRVLITTYTNENLRQIERRILARSGVIPDHISLTGWFKFLLNDGVRPYQAAIFNKVGFVKGLNFLADRPRYTRRDDPRYFLDTNKDVWRDAMADLVCRIEEMSGGAVTRRLAGMYDHIFIDEVQDLVGYDLEILDLLFSAPFRVTAVGDPRQHLYSTNNAQKNKKYRGAGIVHWLDERSGICVREDRSVSYRCNQDICEFASALFPDYPSIDAAEDVKTGYDGIQTISRFDVLDFAAEYRPQVLRNDRRTDTQGLDAMNFGVSKGSTFNRILIFPTRPMKSYLDNRDPSKLKRPESLYVAVTRARHSVTFVV
jgi:DNA helicase II / ATP-dependent DNA helicase PcrA